MGVPGIDPARDAGAYVDPEDWNALIGAPDVVVIDTRNDYEVDIGTFSGAINPQTASFSDFPDWFDRLSSGFGDKPPRIAMFCTGGIRCEKAKIGRASRRERVCQYVSLSVVPLPFTTTPHSPTPPPPPTPHPPPPPPPP